MEDKLNNSILKPSPLSSKNMILLKHKCILFLKLRIIVIIKKRKQMMLAFHPQP